MWVEPTSTAIGVALCIIAWQQYQIRCLDTDIDNIIDKHNEFVETVSTVFETILEAQIQEDENQ